MSSNGSFLAPPVEELQPHFPQYTINEFAAVGGMGAVYRATQVSVDRPVALKILPAEMARDEAFQKRFVMEAKAMARLNHRNLVQLYDFGETNGIFWMTQEWVHGRTIFDVMHEEERLTPKEAAALVAQACEGLGYAHKLGIVHRDVKPANMMVDNEGILKLMDFGLAAVVGSEGMRSKSGGRYATEEYAAPELWDLKVKLDHRVDIFALGVLLYEALTGERPTGTFRLPSELRPGLDKRYDAIVVRAMQRERERRYQSCGDLLSALRTVVTSPPQVKLQAKKPAPATAALKLKTPPPPSPPPKVALASRKTTGAVPLVSPAVKLPPQAVMAPQKKNGAKGFLTVAGVLVLVGAVGAGWMALSGKKEREPAKAKSEKEAGESASSSRISESDQERIERRARERAARLANRPAEPVVNPEPTPEADPGPTPVPFPSPQARPIAEVLQALDEELRAKSAEAFKAYADAAAELKDQYLEEYQKEEERAIQAGDLDAVLQWQQEARALEAGGDVLPDDRGAPARALDLRKAWRARMGPLKRALAPMHLAYLEKCEELHEAAGSREAKSALRERRDQVARFHHFIALCAGDAPPFPGDSLKGSGKELVAAGKPKIGGSLAFLDDQLKAGQLTGLPGGSKEFRGNYYLIVPGPLNWQRAKEWCEARGGHLATLARQEEWEWFGRNMGGPDVLVLLGAELQGDQWVWITGESWSGTPRWAPGQPNNSGGNQNVLGWENNGFNDLSQAPIAFVVEWEAEAFRPDILATIEGLLPAQMVEAYTTTVARLNELEKAGDRTGLAAAIKEYGRALVRDERILTRQREIEAAKATRRIKEEMLDRLEGISDTPAAESAPRGKPERVLIVERGAPTEHGEFDRKLWRRKGRTLVTEGIDRDNDLYPRLTATPSIGHGDFRVQIRMTSGRIGATSLQVWLGETFLHLDDQDGRIRLHRCGASINQVQGKGLGSLAKAGMPMEVVIGREGTALEVKVNGKPGLQATIHERELGQVVLYAGRARLELEHLSVEGILDDAPDSTIVVGSGKLGWESAIPQLISTGNGGLTSLVLASDGQRSKQIWARRSRDGGGKWDEPYAVAGGDDFQVEITSLAAGCDERRDQIYLAMATGMANQRIYLATGRNGGRNWSGPVEITDMVKKPGWNVWLAAQGLVISRGQKNPGRVILPMLADQEAGSSLYLLVSDDSGRTWKSMGPLAKTDGGAELMEDESGELWMGIKGPSSGKVRMMMSSTDGGNTWSEPALSALPDARVRGSLAVGPDGSNKPVWYYASSDVVKDEEGEDHRTHLTLYGSRDGGKTWRELRRMHFGGWRFPTVVALGPNRCGIGFRRDSHSTNYQQVRFVAADGLWEE